MSNSTELAVLQQQGDNCNKAATAAAAAELKKESLAVMKRSMGQTENSHCIYG